MLETFPPALMAASAAIEALTSKLAAEQAAAAAVLSSLVPPAADIVSIGSVSGYHGQIAQHFAAATPGTAHLGEDATEVNSTAVNYQQTDNSGSQGFLHLLSALTEGGGS